MRYPTNMGYKLPLLALFLVLILVGAALVWRSFASAPSQAPARTATLPVESPSINGIPVQSQVQKPDAFAASFYRWYVYNFGKVSNPKLYAKLVSELDQWLTPEFATQYADTATNGDVNPITFAQDFYASWPGAIGTAMESQSATAARVLVSLGTGPELTRLDVSLALTSKGWRISGVVPAK